MVRVLVCFIGNPNATIGHIMKGTWNINGRPTIALDAFLSNNKGLPINVSPTPSKDEFAYGDINGDKDINSIDFALLRNYLLGFSKEFPMPMV